MSSGELRDKARLLCRSAYASWADGSDDLAFGMASFPSTLVLFERPLFRAPSGAVTTSGYSFSSIEPPAGRAVPPKPHRFVPTRVRRAGLMGTGKRGLAACGLAAATSTAVLVDETIQ